MRLFNILGIEHLRLSHLKLKCSNEMNHTDPLIRNASETNGQVIRCMLKDNIQKRITIDNIDNITQDEVEFMISVANTKKHHLHISYDLLMRIYSKNLEGCSYSIPIFNEEQINMFRSSTCKQRDLIKSNNQLYNESSSILIEERNKTMYSQKILILCRDGCLKWDVMKTRLSKEFIRQKFPNWYMAFFPNFNLHKVHENSQDGYLTALFYKASWKIAIFLGGSLSKSSFLVWKASRTIDLIYWNGFNVCLNEILEKWELATLNTNEAEVFFLSQVYGPKLKIVIQTPKIDSVSISPEGPDKTMTITKMQKCEMECRASNTTEYNVIYMLRRDVINRIPGNDKKRSSISIPLLKKRNMGFYFIETFVDVDIASVKKHLKDNYDMNDYQNLFQHAMKESKFEIIGEPYEMIVPIINTTTRLKIVNDQDFNLLKQKCRNVRHGGSIFLFGNESGSLNVEKNRGVQISCIGIEDSLSQIKKNLSFEHVQLMHEVYGNGASRKSCSHIGLSTYRGRRESKRCHELVSVAPNTSCDHQYFSTLNNTYPLGQQFAEGIVADLSEAAECFGRRENPYLFSFISHSCKTSILTSGSPKSYKKRKHEDKSTSTKTTLKSNVNNNFLGFSCGKHIDTCDILTADFVEKEIKLENRPKYVSDILAEVGTLGMPTTCQYFHMWCNPEDASQYDVNGYFMYHSYGIAHQFLDKSSFTFLGFAFEHNSSLIVLKHKSTKKVITKNNPDIFSLLAWGSGGDKNNVRRTLRGDRLP